jgi:cytochrome c oxidase subunit 3
MNTLKVEHIDFQNSMKQKTAKPLLWVGLMSIVMFFASLTSAVLVMKPANSAGSFELPSIFTLSTLVIILSSLFFHGAMLAIRKDNLRIAQIGFLITLILGITFGITQYFAWIELYENGVVFSGGSAINSFFYVITGLHFAHVFGGIVSLIIVLIKSFRKKYSSENYLGVQISITYWHFLGALWIYLFFFLRIIA